MSASVRVLEIAHSPFCIPIVRALEACGVEVVGEEVPNWDRRAVAEATGGNYYEVPVLIHGGEVVYERQADSQDVANYIDRIFAGGRLFPDWAGGLQEIVIRYLENDVELDGFRLVDPEYCDELDPISRLLVIRHKERKFGKGCVEVWRRDRQQLLKRMEAHLLNFEKMLTGGQREFLLGDAPVYTDFLLFGVLGNFLWKGWNEIPESCPRLAAWRERMAGFAF